MPNDLIKIELGCGAYKTPGYIGVDRFPIPGVDIVADLNGRFPFDDDTADIVYAQHSLEHLDDPLHVFSEIVRICKHGAIVMIMSPYFFTSTNIANFFHKIVFNEDTMRFFSMQPTDMIARNEYECPHAKVWGIETSDNHEGSMEIQPLHQEYYYFDGYEHLSGELKLMARRSLLNVCDSFFFSCVINKSRSPFTRTELEKYAAFAKTQEPDILSFFRERPSNPLAPTIFSHVDKVAANTYESALVAVDKAAANTYESALAAVDKAAANTYESALAAVDKAAANTYESALAAVNKTESDLRVTIRAAQDAQNRIEGELRELQRRHESLASHVLDLLKLAESKKAFGGRFLLFRRYAELFGSLQALHAAFFDELLLYNGFFSARSTLAFSPVIPFHDFFAYPLSGQGNSLSLFFIGTIGSKVVAELVQNETIVCQKSVTVGEQGVMRIQIDGMLAGGMHLRLRALDNISILRVLEIHNRKKLFLADKYIAGYLSVR